MSPASPPSLTSIAICGQQSSSLAKALRQSFHDAGCLVLDIRASDLKLPPPSLAELLDGVQCVINLYGEPYVAKWKGRYEFDIYRSRLVAIRALGLAMRYCTPKPTVFVTLSNSMVYDQYEVHDEYSSVYGDTLMSEVGRMETTETLKVATQEMGIRILLLRQGYLMSRLGGAYPLLSKLAHIGWGGCVDDGYQCLPMIHIADSVAAIRHLIDDQEAQGIYNLTIPEMASMNELVKAFATTTSRSQHRLPKWLIRLLTGRAINLLEQNCKAIPGRLLTAGFKFQFPNVEAIVNDLQK